MTRIVPGSIIHNDPMEEDEVESESEFDPDDEDDEDEEVSFKKERTTWENSSEKYDPVPLPEHMIREEYAKMQSFLPIPVRARNTENPVAVWIGVSLDLKTSRFQLQIGNSSIKEFVDPTTLLREMMGHMTEDEQSMVVPLEKIQKFKDPRLRPWAMMEGYIQDQGWFVLGKILKCMYRIKKSAQDWLDRNLKPAKKTGRANSKSKSGNSKALTVKKESGTGGLALNPPVIQYKNKKGQIRNFDHEDIDESPMQDLVLCLENIDEMIKRGAPDEDELRLIVHQKLAIMDWQQLNVLNAGADRLILGLPSAPDRRVILRKTAKRQIKGDYESSNFSEDSDGENKVRKRKSTKVIKLKRVKSIKECQPESSDCEGETVIKRIRLTASSPK